MNAITFAPARNPMFRGSLPESVTGQSTAYGLVIHPTINGTVRALLGYWDVSDPQTGCLVACGDYPGREGAIAALVQLANSYQATGGLHRALQKAREVLRSTLH